MAAALHIFLLQLTLGLFSSLAEANDPRKIYLVQMKVGGHRYGSSSGHQDLLSEVLDDEIEEANYFGLAKGTLRGGVPNAKISVYKTCWRKRTETSEGETYLACPDSSVLQAIEDAIKDKVDIISYAQGLGSPRPLHEDPIAWAFLRAHEKGILTSAVAGNSWDDYTVENGSPWIMQLQRARKIDILRLSWSWKAKMSQ